MPHHCCIYLRIKISHPFKKLTKYEGSYDFFHSMAVTSYPDLGPWHNIFTQKIHITTQKKSKHQVLL